MTHTEVAQIQVPLTDFVREVAKEAAREVIEEHTRACPIVEVGRRVRMLEISFAKLLGFMVGSGLLGGGAGAVAAKLIGV